MKRTESTRAGRIPNAALAPKAVNAVRPARVAAEGTAPRSASILSPAIDLLLVGGLSLIFLVPLLVSGRNDLLFIGIGAQAFLATTINMPHFMASYRLVYRSRASILRHPWASIYVPIILLIYIVIALWQAQYSPTLVIILVSISSAYLAWHYTGQVWGMMASFAYLHGTPFDKSERRLIRTGLRLLLAWHLMWFLYTQLADPSRVRLMYQVATAGTVVAFVLGVIGLARMHRRTGRFPPARALVAWLALFVWYAVMARDPKAIFWIQIAHALQYLAFPIRVEMNTRSAAIQSARKNALSSSNAARLVLHMAFYAAALLLISFIVSAIVPARAMDVVGVVFGEEPAKVAPVL
ncbi:MAG: hypothetical protein M3Y64_09550, partial [Gemmatimonadota bacterium]|nr:hypothetical protein [Gemmatimonadota bacterium]